MSLEYCQICGQTYERDATHFCKTNKPYILSNPETGSILSEEEYLARIDESYILNSPVPVEEIGSASNKYMREIKPDVWVDVYDVLEAFSVTDAAMAHALKKMLAMGIRGHKDEAEDRKDIYDSVVRSNQIFETKRKK